MRRVRDGSRARLYADGHSSSAEWKHEVKKSRLVDEFQKLLSSGVRTNGEWCDAARTVHKDQAGVEAAWGNRLRRFGRAFMRFPHPL